MNDCAHAMRNSAARQRAVALAARHARCCAFCAQAPPQHIYARGARAHSAHKGMEQSSEE